MKQLKEIILGKKISKKSFQYADDIANDSFEDANRNFNVEVSFRTHQISFTRQDFEKNKYRLLEPQMSKIDWDKLIKASKNRKGALVDIPSYKTKDGLSAYFYVVESPESGLSYLISVGYGEWQPCRYVFTIESIHEIE